MTNIHPQDRWLEIYNWYQNFNLARQAFIQRFQDSEIPLFSTSEMENCYLEAGRILFEMMGAPSIPSEQELVAAYGKPVRAKQQEPLGPVKGLVYVMVNKRNEFFKIGFSKNPIFREATLQSQEPEIELLCSMRGTLADEQRLHEHFSQYRVRGEWFNLPPEELMGLVKQMETAYATEWPPSSGERIYA